MQWVALLRGINIGGKNKVDMKRLVKATEKAGFSNVSTYINSGNLFFTGRDTAEAMIQTLESIIETEFKLNIKVLLRSKDRIDKVTAAIPQAWENGAKMKCDIMFLWPKYDHKEIISRLALQPKIDDVRYVDGALLWKVDRENASRSAMMKLPGTDLYANMTVRNCNTVRKIQQRLYTT